MPKVTQQENGRVSLNSHTLDAETHIFDFCANQCGALVPWYMMVPIRYHTWPTTTAINKGKHGQDTRNSYFRHWRVDSEELWSLREERKMSWALKPWKPFSLFPRPQGNISRRGNISGKGPFQWVEEADLSSGKQRQLETTVRIAEKELHREKTPEICTEGPWVCCWTVSSKDIGWKSMGPGKECSKSTGLRVHRAGQLEPDHVE